MRSLLADIKLLFHYSHSNNRTISLTITRISQHEARRSLPRPRLHGCTSVPAPFHEHPLTAPSTLQTLTAASPARTPLQLRDLEWIVQVTPDRNVTLSGTIEEVHAELLRLNPNWDGEHAVVAGEPEGSSSNPKRQDWLGPFSSHYCGGPWQYQVTASFWEGLQYLRRIQGRVHMTPGPGACGRVSCSYDSAIVLCNDVSSPIGGLSGSEMADKSVFLSSAAHRGLLPGLVEHGC